LVPGAGSLIALVERSTQQRAFYIGKPEPTIMEKALKKMGLPKEAVAMVGDNYNTDIKAGLNAGIDTILVYTGVSTRDYVSKQVHQPTHQIDALTDWEV
jgi:4-nitrophenyl phosphatase